ncbi:hypothetical protein IAQ61_001699 [Plenodomus lingam]|uniref:DUF7707 domain-containing protein n=1 Tax=Leptosphaeria maculans (strain JN3 / isolate v23.1.3 / race Av1-4-5-6-7-8) TaxID=985895 RepID=E4ZFY2_LEPMJ|nr:predicted protein [Plenodomus lingam JN3]KAH9878427.1 hypothetical protein IAQ61_001699 [Plenodomus lingam]CBX90202.1 predicted protein [Plenodomus lingam JN3]
MLYSTIMVAASAFVGFAAAQNNSNTPIPCCSLPATQIPEEERATMCNANENTCVELCGGLGNIASNGNECDDDTLETSCRCANGTDITANLADYQQSVAGLMCQNFWFDACISASGSDATAQRSCVSTREAECGNRTTDGASSGGSNGGGSSSASPSATQSSNGGATPSPSGSGGAAATTTAAGGAANLAVYGTPALAGGLLALFGFIL